MKVTLDQFINNIAKLEAALPQINEAAFTEAANDLQSQVLNRIDFEGKDASGQPFKPYSKQYLKYKASVGRADVGFFRLTGDMLNKVKMFPATITGTTIKANIGTEGAGMAPPIPKEDKKKGKKTRPFIPGQSPTNREKMEYQEKTRGKVLATNNEEIAKSKTVYKNRVMERIETALFK